MNMRGNVAIGNRNRAAVSRGNKDRKIDVPLDRKAQNTDLMHLRKQMRATEKRQ